MADGPGGPLSGDHKAGSPMAEGIALARAGDQAGARAVFRRMIHQNPDNEDAWLWLAWVAESRAHSLRYLREAQALLPDSPRLEEAVAWANQDAAAQVGTPDSALREHKAPRPSKAATTFPAEKAERAPRIPAAQAAPRATKPTPQPLGETFDQLKDKVAGIRLPRVRSERLRALGMPLVSVLAVIAMVLVVLIVIRLARGSAPTVLALTLPTPVANPTATPTVDQLTDPYWVQVDVALGQGNYDAAVAALQRIRELDPRNEDARKQLAAACYQRGVALIAANDLEAARVELDEALRLDAGYAPLQELRRQLKLYVDGVAAYWAQDWPLAVQNLKKVYTLNPDFRDGKTMLAQAYYQVGVELAAGDTWEASKEALDASLALEPERADAQALMTSVMAELIPLRRIEVDLSDQVVTVYDGGQVIHTFACCTGRSTSPTLPGRYKIQTKMPMAYASAWDLDMPDWLGIYYAGGSENGFHAVPLRNGGQVLWRNSMGTPCSFGCIVLDTPDAEELYAWAEIGTAVLVNW